jgi:hypothetical protein
MDRGRVADGDLDTSVECAFQAGETLAVR